MPNGKLPNAMSSPLEEYNCKLCPEPDIPEMVACDKCNAWFHFQCVKVDSAVNDTSWMCEPCRHSTAHQPNPRSNPSSHPPSRPPSHPPSQPPSQPPSHPISPIENVKSKSSKSRRKRDLLIQRLEEEKQLREQSNQQYLKEKYKILCEFSSSDEDLEKGKSVEVDRTKLTKMWVEKLKNHAPETCAMKNTNENPIKSVVVPQRQPDPCNVKHFESQPSQIQTKMPAVTMNPYDRPDPYDRMRIGRPDHILHAMIAKAMNQAPPKAD